MNKVQRLAIFASILGLSLLIINVTIITLAIPQITGEIKFQYLSTHWIINSYVLAMAISGITVGRMSDIFSSKNIKIIGFILFAVSSIGCIYSSNEFIFLFFRFTQGISTIFLSVPTLKLLSEIFPKDEFARAIGILTGSAAIVAAISPFLIGAMVQFLNWKWLFSTNIPLCLIAIYSLLLIENIQIHKSSVKFDATGIILLSISLFLFVFGLMEGESNAWDQKILLMITISIVLLIFFILFEQKSKYPVIDLKLFKNKTYTISLLISALTHAQAMSAIFWIMFIQQLISKNAFSAGILFSPFYIGFALSGFLSSKLTKSYKSNIILINGIVLTIAGYVLSILLIPAQDYFTVLPVLICSGLGFCLILNPIRVMAINSMPKDKRGTAMGLMNNIRHILGTIIFALFSIMMPVHLSNNINNINEFYNGFYYIMIFTLLMMLACLVLYFFLIKSTANNSN